MTNQPDMYQFARHYLAQEKQTLTRNVPPAIAALIGWRSQTYIGSIQEVASEYSQEIVLLSKSSQPIPEELRKAISELDKDRLHLTAETMLDLEGKLHILRKVGDILQKMTADQLKYMEGLPQAVIDGFSWDITTETESHRYMDLENMGSSRN